MNVLRSNSGSARLLMQIRTKDFKTQVSDRALIRAILMNVSLKIDD
jgi:hypothetical protein